MASMLHAEPGAGNKTAAGKEHLRQRKGCLQAVLAILPEPEREPAWLKTQPAPRIVEGEILAGQPEGSNPLLARLQKQLAEAFELAHRQSDRGNLILHIALHHRVAGAGAGVAHPDGSLHRAVAVILVDRAAVALVVVVQRNLPAVAGQCDRQTARGLGPAVRWPCTMFEPLIIGRPRRVSSTAMRWQRWRSSQPPQNCSSSPARAEVA